MASKRVHALSSFQRTKGFISPPADRSSALLDYFPAPFRGTLRDYDGLALVSILFSHSHDIFVGASPKLAVSSAVLSLVFAKPGDLPGSHDVLDREPRVTRVSRI